MCGHIFQVDQIMVMHTECHIRLCPRKRPLSKRWFVAFWTRVYSSGLGANTLYQRKIPNHVTTICTYTSFPNFTVLDSTSNHRFNYLLILSIAKSRKPHTLQGNLKTDLSPLHRLPHLFHFPSPYVTTNSLTSSFNQTSSQTQTKPYIQPTSLPSTYPPPHHCLLDPSSNPSNPPP